MSVSVCVCVGGISTESLKSMSCKLERFNLNPALTGAEMLKPSVLFNKKKVSGLLFSESTSGLQSPSLRIQNNVRSLLINVSAGSLLYSVVLSSPYIYIYDKDPQQDDGREPILTSGWGLQMKGLWQLMCTVPVNK